MDLAICICTYKRIAQLGRLIEDLFKQSLPPSYLIVVDGDQESTEVPDYLALQTKDKTKIYYIRSNHSNLPYQRYIGWKIAEDLGYDILLYLDDDLYIANHEAISILISRLSEKEIYVGATATITSSQEQDGFLNEIRRPNENILVKKFGDSARHGTGYISPVGQRIPPEFGTEDTAEIQWLQGRIMAFKSNVITKRDFSEVLFAMYEAHVGKGEDTYLTRKALTKGKLIMANVEGFYHPADSIPNAYPVKMGKLGYAVAYSRRFLNDHYRLESAPTVKDRLALVKHYFGNNLLNFKDVVIKYHQHRFAYAWGYLRGSLRGIFQKPTAKRLTPEINWWQDAETALAGLQTIHEKL